MTSPVLSSLLPVRLRGARGYALTAIGVFAFLWASIEAAGFVTLRNVGGWQVVFTRYAIHLAMVLALWGHRAPWKTRRLGFHLARSAMMLIMPASFLIAEAHGVSPGWMLAIFWCAPLLVVAMAATFAHEHVSLATCSAAMVGWAAAAAFYAPRGLPSLTAVVLGLAMAASFAAYVPMTRALRDEPLRTNLFYTAVVPWAVLLPFMPDVWFQPSRIELGGLTFIGVVGFLTLAALDRGVDAMPSADTTPFMVLQVLFTILFASTGEPLPTVHRLMVFAVLLVITLVLAWRGMRHKPSAAAVTA